MTSGRANGTVGPAAPVGAGSGTDERFGPDFRRWRANDRPNGVVDLRERVQGWMRSCYYKPGCRSAAGGGGEVEEAGRFGQVECGEDDLLAGGERGALGDLAVAGGIGFTVSLLVGELSFESGSAQATHVKTAVLLASLTAAALGGALLAWRGHRAQRKVRQ